MTTLTLEKLFEQKDWTNDLIVLPMKNMWRKFAKSSLRK